MTTYIRPQINAGGWAAKSVLTAPQMNSVQDAIVDSLCISTPTTYGVSNAVVSNNTFSGTNNFSGSTSASGAFSFNNTVTANAGVSLNGSNLFGYNNAFQRITLPTTTTPVSVAGMVSTVGATKGDIYQVVGSNSTTGLYNQQYIYSANDTNRLGHSGSDDVSAYLQRSTVAAGTWKIANYDLIPKSIFGTYKYVNITASLTGTASAPPYTLTTSTTSELDQSSFLSAYTRTILCYSNSGWLASNNDANVIPKASSSGYVFDISFSAVLKVTGITSLPVAHYLPIYFKVLKVNNVTYYPSSVMSTNYVGSNNSYILLPGTTVTTTQAVNINQRIYIPITATTPAIDDQFAITLFVGKYSASALTIVPYADDSTVLNSNTDMYPSTISVSVTAY